MEREFYRQKLSSLGSVTFDSIQRISIDAVKAFAENDKDKIYSSLDRGKAILTETQQLEQYMFSFGKQHHEKLLSAFQCLPSHFYDKTIRIIDWGCGQGMGTISFLDFLRSTSKTLPISEIWLIEPSSLSIERAIDNIYAFGNYKIKSIEKEFDDLETRDFHFDHTPDITNVHIFANILDVKAFDLFNFINLVQRVSTGDNYFICVGPYYQNCERLEDFVTAINPDIVYGKADDIEWKNWTRYMRVFHSTIQLYESSTTLKKRVLDTKRHRQFQAGYILEAVYSELKKSPYWERHLIEDSEPIAYSRSKAESLLSSLSCFDVSSSSPIIHPEDIDPIVAVVNNLISRGLPTLAPLGMEEAFSKYFSISESGIKLGAISFNSTGELPAEDIFRAMHIIDPRMSLSDYNYDILESSFEKDFVTRYLSGNASFLRQLLEPQRELSSIVEIPDRRFVKDQRVDFALDAPYSEKGEEHNVGFITEIDGEKYHSAGIQTVRDKKRDELTKKAGHETYRITSLQDKTAVANWLKSPELWGYLLILKDNYNKTITGKWKNTLQAVLTPFAVARVQKVIIEAILSGNLDMNANSWKILVNERDVPCAALAIENIEDIFSNLFHLEGKGRCLPQIDLSIVSNNDFSDSPLHLGRKLVQSMDDSEADIIIDISILLRSKISKADNIGKAKAFYLIRSSHREENTRVLLTAEPISYKPLIAKNDKGEYVESNNDGIDSLRFFIQNIFRKRDFRPGQLPILSRALQYRNTIGLLPTGGGKSLTYQLAALLQPGITIIVDPLVSLMTDQYNGLRDLLIDCCSYVNSTLSAVERQRNMNKMLLSEVLLEFMSPERFMIESFRDSLSAMAPVNGVYHAYGVIDEVHCVSEWGHDFRTAYLHLGRNMSRFMKAKGRDTISIIGLTATASFDVLADVERELTLGSNLTIDQDVIVKAEEEQRLELNYEVVQVFPEYHYSSEPDLIIGTDWTMKDCVYGAKRAEVLTLFDYVTEELNRINERIPAEGAAYDTRIPGYDAAGFFDTDSNGTFENAGIIFCPHRSGGIGVRNKPDSLSKRSSLSEFIAEKKAGNYKIDTFIGGDNAESSLSSFKSNRSNIMVATKAFGMGIDKPNVRFTININYPSSIESFVQEAGRAGRDRKNAISYIVYCNDEYIKLESGLISTIKKELGERFSWLDSYQERIVVGFDERKDTQYYYLLVSNIEEFCHSNGCDNEDTATLRSYLEKRKMTVDRENILYFHNKSFKGKLKERMIMMEFTRHIQNAVMTNCDMLQSEFRDILGNDDIVIKMVDGRNAVKISSESDSRQLCFIFLDNFTRYNKYVAENDLQRGTVLYNLFLEILFRHLDENSIDRSDSFSWLKAPCNPNVVDGENSGIYSIINDSPDGSSNYITISWGNVYQQDENLYKKEVLDELMKIQTRYPTIITTQDLNDVVCDLASFNSDIGQLFRKLDSVSKVRGWWTTYIDSPAFNGIKQAFYKYRDKDDTEKIIYRMCCMGLIDDVTVDYISQTYRIRVVKRPNGGYKECLLQFLEKYYSPQRARQKIKDLDSRKGDNEIDKCLGFLLDFVYDATETKRRRAIDDMVTACEIGLNDNGGDLKNYIYYYFNSKYARPHYSVFVNGEEKPYSLKEDIDADDSNREWITKYIDAASIDESGSEMDNVKHLNGAVQLLLRSKPENGILNILKAYCLTYLGFGSNNSLRKEMESSLNLGFVNYFKDVTTSIDHRDEFPEVPSQEYCSFIDGFLQTLKSVAKDDISHIIDGFSDGIMLCLHDEWLTGFKNKYTKI